MKRLFEPEAYASGSDPGNYWHSTVTDRHLPCPVLEEDIRADVVIIGAGYTGLSAALHLTRDHHLDVVVVEAETPGWGASGRNGGFCCHGGSLHGDQDLLATYGKDEFMGFHHAQHRSIDLVREILDAYAIEADTHSNGELILAHRAKDMCALTKEAAFQRDMLGMSSRLLSPSELVSEGATGTGFHGGLHIPLGFALNPLKYTLGLTKAAFDAGARIFGHSPAIHMARSDHGRYVVQTETGRVIADKLVLATNGYSSDDLPDWLAGRYMPALSNAIVTRPLTEDEINAQGWRSDLMAYDTRRLLHYFRLMPNRRFLFGMRGGWNAKPTTTTAMKRQIRKSFESLFPAWAQVETPFFWSGMICLTHHGLPFVGEIDDWPGAYAGLAYHGNGVAMGTYAGRLLAGQVVGLPYADDPVPHLMQRPPGRIPLGRFRRWLLPATYKYLEFLDRG